MCTLLIHTCTQAHKCGTCLFDPDTIGTVLITEVVLMSGVNLYLGHF